MENSQGDWIAYGVLLNFNFLNGNIQKIIAVKKYSIIKTAILNN